MPDQSTLPTPARDLGVPESTGQTFPLSAVVGSDDLVLALLLAAVDPGIGGVLVRGEKGTAKTTAVRALAAVLPPLDVVEGDRFSTDPADPADISPDGPFGPEARVRTRAVRLVELPVGASEDRVVGSLHLQRALAHGVAEYEPGLLARAHRGLLYVDEVNLLHDHLVDLLLDAAATGRATVERDGVSVTHPSRFVLVGTMNPEEGELRPQLLDRFGLAVDVAAPRDPALRVEVVRRRMSHDADPAGFAARWAEQERALADRVASARLARAEVDLPDTVLLAVAQVCAALEVDGLRADLVTARTARAHAAWCGRHEVTDEDVRVAARLALPHRRRRSPFDSPDLDDDRLEQALDDALGPERPDPDPDPEPEPDPDPDPESGADGGDDQGAGGPGGGGDPAAAPPTDQPADQPTDQPTGRGSTVAAGDPFRARLLEAGRRGAGIAGRRSRATGTRTGRRVGARSSTHGGVHLLATVLAAVPHQHERGRSVGPLRLAGRDLRTAVREGREANLVLFCVDASGSMAARRRMQEVKAAILSLLLDAYQRRDTVGLVTFAGHAATLVLPPTASVDVAATRLAQLPAGGRTPLAEGLLEAAAVLERERRRPDARRPLLVVVTDGRATSGRDAVRRSHEAAGRIAEQGTAAVVVDCESGPLRMGLAAALADRLRAEHLPLGAVDAAALHGVVRGRAA